MKKIIFAMICSSCIFGYSFLYAQDSTKTDKKSAKAMMKEDKGKHHKAMKKAYKMQKKEDKAK
jgi:hypothetical protein